MMDFSALDLAHKQAGHRSLQKQASTEELINKGLRCLIKGEKKPRDKALLQTAGDCFMEAIPSSYDNPVPFVGMAYLLWLYNDTHKALYFVREALSIQPENVDAQRLLKEIGGKRAANKPPTLVPQGQAVKLEQLKKPAATGQSSAALRQQQQERFKPQPLQQTSMAKPNQQSTPEQAEKVKLTPLSGGAESAESAAQENDASLNQTEAPTPQVFKPKPLARPATPLAPTVSAAVSPIPASVPPTKTEAPLPAKADSQKPVISADELLDDLQALSQDLIGSELMSKAPSWRPHFIAKLESFYTSSQDLFKEIEADYQTLNTADQGKLQSHLKRCESLLKQVHNRWQDCQALAKLEKSMQSEYELVCTQIKEAKNLSSPDDWEVLQENLDGFFELCDQMADQLETFESKSYPLKSLMSNYNDLVAKVTELQQVLEGDE